MAQKIPPSAPHPTLDDMLKIAKDHKMTPEEYRAQRKSWVIGEMMLRNEHMTREQAEAIYDEVMIALGQTMN